MKVSSRQKRLDERARKLQRFESSPESACSSTDIECARILGVRGRVCAFYFDSCSSIPYAALPWWRLANPSGSVQQEEGSVEGGCPPVTAQQNTISLDAQKYQAEIHTFDARLMSGALSARRSDGSWIC